jgi:toxin CptA
MVINITSDICFHPAIPLQWAAMNSPHLQIMELRPSRQLAVILGCAHLGALLALAMLPVAWWLKAGGAAVLLLSTAYAIRRYAWRRGRGAVTALHCIDREQLRVRMHDGNWHAGRVLGSSTVGTSLTLLNIALDGRRLPIHLVLPGDSLAADEFRRLRVWLRWGPQAPAEEGGAP